MYNIQVTKFVENMLKWPSNIIFQQQSFSTENPHIMSAGGDIHIRFSPTYNSVFIIKFFYHTQERYINQMKTNLYSYSMYSKSISGTSVMFWKNETVWFKCRLKIFIFLTSKFKLVINIYICVYTYKIYYHFGDVSKKIHNN